MNVVPQVVFNEDASPLARTFARSLNHALLTPEGARILRAISVPFAIRSLKGKQAVTIDPTDDRIEVDNGVRRKASVVIALDLDDPTVKPVVEKGWIRHPIQLGRITKLLTLPEPSWEESARSFWAVASQRNDCPSGLKVTDLTSGAKLALGNCETGDIVEIQASAIMLRRLMSGQTLLASGAMSGKARYRGSLKQLAGLSQAGQTLMLGTTNG